MISIIDEKNTVNLPKKVLEIFNTNTLIDLYVTHCCCNFLTLDSFDSLCGVIAERFVKERFAKEL